MVREVQSWPYDFVESEDFPRAEERGTVAGQLQVLDRYFQSPNTVLITFYF